MLETRDLPAAFYWLPTLDQNGGEEEIDPHVSVAENWTDASGVRCTTAPTPADDLYFTGQPVPGWRPTGAPTYAWADAYISAQDANASGGALFNSVHILASYGTLHLEIPTTVGTFEMRGGGGIAQNENGGSSAEDASLDVTVAFTWTGGVLNNSGNAGTVNIVGVYDATVGDGTDTSYTTGSDLKLTSGTTMIASGSIVLNNDAGLWVDAGCSFDTPELDGETPPPPTSPPQPPAGQPSAGQKWVNLIAGLKGGTEGQRIEGIGMVLLEGDAAGFGRVDDPVWVTGGRLRVSKRDMDVTKWFTTRPDGGPTNEQSSSSVYVTSGTLIITEGRTLKAINKVEIAGTGVLSTQSDNRAPTQIARIDANLLVRGGTVELGKNAGVAHIASTLLVLKDVRFLGGIYRPYVRATLSTECDLWKADGKFTFDTAAKIDPIVYGVIQNPGAGVNGNGVGLSWQVIYARDGFVDATKPTTSVAADWAIDKGTANAGDPIQWESIKVNRLR